MAGNSLYFIIYMPMDGLLIFFPDEGIDNEEVFDALTWADLEDLMKKLRIGDRVMFRRWLKANSRMPDCQDGRQGSSTPSTASTVNAPPPEKEMGKSCPSPLEAPAQNIV